MEGILRRTRGPHVHVEHHEVRRLHVGDGNVAKPVQRIDGPFDAAQAATGGPVHAVLLGLDMRVERQTETLRVVGVADKVGDGDGVGGVEVDGDANGTRGDMGEGDPTLPNGQADRGRRRGARD